MIPKNTYTKIVKLYSDRIHSFIYKQLKDKAVAEDLTQECFLRLWKKSFFIQEITCKSWLFTTANNLILNHIRDNKKVNYSDNVLDKRSFNLQDNYELKELLDNVFNFLDLEEKTIVLLRDSEGYSYEEIGKILDLSEANVKSKIFRARKHFKEVYLSIQKQALKNHDYAG